MKVPVYKFEFYDRSAWSWRQSKDWATKAAIDAMGALILPSTEEWVDAEALTPGGMAHRVEKKD